MTTTSVASKYLWIVSIVLVLQTSISCVRLQDRIPLDKDSLKGSGQLYLVPLGTFPTEGVNHLASFLRDKYGIQVQTLASVTLPPTAINQERNQLIAEKAIDIMKQANPQLTNDSQAIMIGITNQDMYIAKYDWQFAFSYRQEGKYAVVSGGRMNLPNGNQEVTAELIVKRIRKMVTRNVGILYYRLPLSDNPHSVLYRNVLDIDELDYIGEEF